MIEELSQDQFQKRGSGFYCDPPWLSSEKKDAYKRHRLNINLNLKELKECEVKHSQYLFNIGRSASEIRSLVRESNQVRASHKRISEKTVFRELFNSDASRIYEAIALYRAVTSGAEDSLPTTSLIRIGEKLGNKHTQREMESILKNDSVILGDEKYIFSELTQKQILKFLKTLRGENHHLNAGDYLRRLISNSEVMLENFKELQGVIGWSRVSFGAFRGDLQVLEGNMQALSESMDDIVSRTTINIPDRNSVHAAMQ